MIWPMQAILTKTPSELGALTKVRPAVSDRDAEAIILMNEMIEVLCRRIARGAHLRRVCQII